MGDKMALRYILGKSGSGKTTLCLQEIMANGFGNKNLILIVPEQFTLESEKNLINLSKDSAIIKCQVLSFNRLAFHVFRELGKTGNKILEQNGKSMLLKKILLSLEKELEYFAKTANKHGFVLKLSEMISEFYRFNISVEKLEEYLELIKERENIYLKFSDLHKIYSKYLEFIKEKYISTDETLDLLSDYIEYSEYLKNSIIYIDNFVSFTPQEYKLIEKLLLHCESVNVSMLTNTNRNRFDVIKNYDPFFETKVTISKITKLAEANKIPILKYDFLSENLRHKKSPELGFLSENFMKFSNDSYVKACEDVKILKAQNIYTEISETAKKIHSLVRDKNYRYREIAIVTASVEENERIIRNIFHSYEIPCFFDTPSDILSHPLTELIRALCEIVLSNFSYESVFRLLKTNMTNIENDDIDLLENYVLENGVKSFKWRIKRWKYGFESGMYDEERIHEIRDKFLSIMDKFEKNPKSKSTVKNFCIKIYNTFEYLEVTKTLENWILSIDDKSSVMLRQHKQIWPKIIGMLEKLVEILGDEIVTFKEFAKILDAGLEEIEMSIIPPSNDCVIVGDHKRTRLPEIRALFLIGVNEGKIPSLSNESGLISDDERIFLREKGIELDSDSNTRYLKEMLMVYESFAKANEFLQFSYSLGTLSGSSLQPSTVIHKVKNIFLELCEIAPDNQDYIDMPKPTFEKFGKILRNYSKTGEMADSEINLYSFFKHSEEYSDKVSSMEKILFFDKNPKYLSDNTAKKQYGKELITSVTRLERFVQCPFSYFVQYNLDAKERSRFEISQLDIGSLFHKVIERFTKVLDERGLSFREISRTQINEIVEKCVDELAAESKSEVFLSTAKLKYAIKRIKRISKQSIWALTEHIKKGSFEPLAHEIEFSGPATSILIDLKDGKKIIISGRIDRVDCYDYDGNRYIKIIDYKSGSTKFDLTDIYYGMQLQILIYLDALLKASPNIFNKENLKLLPGGVFYFNINDPVLDYTDVVNETLDYLKLKEFKMSGLVLKDDRIISAMDNEFSKSSIIIPVEKKKDSGFTALSSVAASDEFESVLNFINERVAQLGEEIFKGNIDVFPYKKGNNNGCDYCKYSAICQIDASERKNKFNILKKVYLDDFIPKV